MPKNGSDTAPKGLIQIFNRTTGSSYCSAEWNDKSNQTPRSHHHAVPSSAPMQAVIWARHLSHVWGGFTYATLREISHIGRSPTKETQRPYATKCLRPKWQPMRRSVHLPDTYARTTIQVAIRATDTGRQSPTSSAAGHNDLEPRSTPCGWSLRLSRIA